MHKWVLVALALLSPGAISAAVPAGFTDSLVTGVSLPTSMAFLPDNQILITRQPGILSVYNGSTLVPTPALTIPSNRICTDNERGLLGVAVDPDFNNTRHIFLFYSYLRPELYCVNRVSRFTLPPSMVIDPASETVLIDNMPAKGGTHNAGDLHFARDGYLYISIGDGGCDYAEAQLFCAADNNAARDLHALTGKILRITKTGDVPPTNPFVSVPGAVRCNVTGIVAAGQVCTETFSWGLRNPFRIAFDPNDAGVRFFINDVGQDAWEEINLGAPGADYGWNYREGAHPHRNGPPPPPPGMVDPIFEYPHHVTVPGTTQSACNSITGGAFPPNGLWPTFDGSYLYSDYVCGAIFKLTNSGGTWSTQEFATGLGPVIALRFGPSGSTTALYYTSYTNGGEIRKIERDAAGNQAPTAVIGANPTSGPAPLAVNFTAAGSSDPDAGDTLTYFWDFGDGTPETSTTSLTTQHTYQNTGTFVAKLRARDQNFQFSPQVSTSISVGNAPPVPVITSPGAADLYSVGQTITMTGSATDPQDGTLPATALSWRVLIHHDAHTHPYVTPTSGNNITFTAPAPEGLSAANNSFLEIILTATDSSGLTAEVSRNIQPRKVAVNFDTNPAGRTITLNTLDQTAPFSITSWANWGLNVNAPNATVGSTRYTFQSWSDGGAQSHVFTTPATATTLTANFLVEHQLTTAANPVGGGTVTPASGSFYAAGSSVNITATPNACFTLGSFSPNVVAGAVTMSGPQTVTANFIGNVASVVNGQVSATIGGPRVDRRTGRTLQTLVLTNTGAALSNVALVLHNLPAGVTFHNATAATTCVVPSGAPLAEIGSLATGQTLELVLEFSKPATTALTYSPTILAGPGSR
jgi:glucose/arabinose dehydrogenase